MTETVSQILKGGYQTWKSNLGISCVNLLWDFISLMVFGFSLISLLIPIFTHPAFTNMLEHPELYSSMTPEEANAFGRQIGEEIAKSIDFSAFVGPVILIVACFLLIILIEFFMTGGIYGMIRDVTLNGSFTYRNFFRNGKKYYLRILAACIIQLIIGIIFSIIIGLLIGIVLGLFFAIIIIASGNSDAAIMAMSTIINIVATLFVTALLYPLVSIVLAVVIEDDKKTFDAIKKGFSFMMSNFKDLVKIGFVFGILSAFCSALGILPGGFIISFIAMSLIIVPLSVFWGFRVYMDRCGMINACSCASCGGQNDYEYGAFSENNECSENSISEDDSTETVSDAESADSVNEEKIYVDENGKIVPCGPPDYPELGGYRELKK